MSFHPGLDTERFGYSFVQLSDRKDKEKNKQKCALKDYT